MIKLSPEAYKEVFDQVQDIISLGGNYPVKGSTQDTDEFWFAGIKYVKDEDKVNKQVISAPIVIDTNGGLYGKDVGLTVNGVIIDGIRWAKWSTTPTGMHELELAVLGVKTKGEV